MDRKADAAERRAEIGILPAARVARRGDHHADEREARTQVTRHPPADDQEEDERAHARHQDRDVGVEAHQQRREHRGAEHRDDVLRAHCDGLRPGQSLVGRDDALGAQGPLREIGHRGSPFRL
jgi:hypothetical protein